MTQDKKPISSEQAKIHSRFTALLARMEEQNAKYSDEELKRDVEEVSRIVRARGAHIRHSG